MTAKPYKAPVHCAAANLKNFLASRPGFISQRDADELESLAQKVGRLDREYDRWTRPAAEAEIVRRRSAAHADPTDANLALLASESPDALRARFEHTATVLYNIRDQVLCDARPLLRRILDALDPVIEREMSAVEKAGRETAERYGVAYEAKEDRVWCALAKFREVAHSRLASETSVLTVRDLRAFLGDLKPRKGGLLG